jgi:hypothetical protein
MKYRCLQIAFSVTCGIVILVLIMLWARSYWMVDSLASKGSETRYVSFHSRHGQVSFVTGVPPIKKPWGLRSSKLKNFTTVEVLPTYRAVFGFGYVRLADGFTVVVPNWFACGVVAVVLGLVVWLSR